MNYKRKLFLLFILCAIPIFIASYSNNHLALANGLRPSCTHECVDGKKTAVTYVDEEGTEYYEYLSSNIENLDRTTVKAGTGFTFEVTTDYSNEWFGEGEVTGPTRVIAHFPSSDESFPISIDLIPVNEVGAWNNTWQLPNVLVEKFSGKIVYDATQSSEELLNGGRKWYTSFDDKDGEYEVKIEVFGAGTSGLTDCKTACLNIKGSPFDDFVVRLVHPENPFPDSVGTNWRGYEGILTNLTGWYYDSGNE